MSDPANPVQHRDAVDAGDAVAARVAEPQREARPARRRLGNPVFYPGIVDIYDVTADCRHPVLKSSLPVGVLGHEGGFAPDGNTF